LRIPSENFSIHQRKFHAINVSEAIEFSRIKVEKTKLINIGAKIKIFQIKIFQIKIFQIKIFQIKIE
jgi:hypothetical protein